MNQQHTVNIEIGDKEWEGIYSNFVIVTHSNSEFIIDFARMLPGVKKAKVFSRILMTPQSAKSLLATLENNISKFEADHGKKTSDDVCWSREAPEATSYNQS